MLKRVMPEGRRGRVTHPRVEAVQRHVGIDEGRSVRLRLLIRADATRERVGAANRLRHFCDTVGVAVGTTRYVYGAESGLFATVSGVTLV